MSSSKNRLLLTGLLLAGSALFGTWWIHWPKRVLEEFVSFTSSGQLQEATELLAAPSSIVSAEHGGVRVLDRNGGTIAVARERLPFLSGQASGSEPPSRGLMDLVLGRAHFAVAATGAHQGEPREGVAVTLFLTAQRGRVHIDRAE